jgi:RimJ/RimL family protein N-acetyltransferase
MTQDDAADVWGIWGDRESGKYLHDPFYRDAEELRALFTDIAEWSDYPFVAFSKATGEFVGTCSVGPEGTGDEWGFGYCVRKALWGNGYATEMARAMIDFAYSLGVRAFVAEHAIENAASGNVMRKCGMSVDRESSFAKSGTGILYPSRVYRLRLE